MEIRNELLFQDFCFKSLDCRHELDRLRDKKQTVADDVNSAEGICVGSYGRNENYAIAESFGVELIAPVPGRAPDVKAEDRTLDDFAHIEVTGSVDACPAGHSPLHVTRDEATHTTVVEMPSAMCASCPLRNLCPIHQTSDGRFESGRIRKCASASKLWAIQGEFTYFGQWFVVSHFSRR